MNKNSVATEENTNCSTLRCAPGASLTFELSLRVKLPAAGFFTGRAVRSFRLLFAQRGAGCSLLRRSTRFAPWRSGPTGMQLGRPPNTLPMQEKGVGYTRRMEMCFVHSVYTEHVAHTKFRSKKKLAKKKRSFHTANAMTAPDQRPFPPWRTAFSEAKPCQCSFP